MIYGDIKNPPPFYKNWDDVHCMECTMRGILECFEQGKLFSRDEINALTHKIEGKCSWPYFSMKWALDNGYKVKFVTPYSLEYILSKGFENYLIETQGEQAAKHSINISPPIADIEKSCKDIANHGNLIQLEKIPNQSDIADLLSDGYLINSMINAHALNGKTTYGGHSVLIYGMDDKNVYFHDSGLPPLESRKEPINFFIQCAKNPKPENWFMIGFKK